MTVKKTNDALGKHQMNENIIMNTPDNNAGFILSIGGNWAV